MLLTTYFERERYVDSTGSLGIGEIAKREQETQIRGARFRAIYERIPPVHGMRILMDGLASSNTTAD